MAKKMKSKRLTKELQHKIKNRAEDWKFKKDNEKLSKMYEGVGDEIYDFFYDDKLKKVINELPEFMVKELSSNYFNVTYHVARKIGFSNKWTNFYFKFSEPKRTFNSHINADTILLIKVGDRKLYNKILKVIKLDCSLSERKEKFKLKLHFLMGQVTTTKKLIDVLPEAENWISEVTACNDLPQADVVAQMMDI